MKNTDKTITIEGYRNRVPVQMRFNDIDIFGHVNNSMMLQYFDLGKVNYFSEVLDGLFNFRRESMVIVHIDVDFIHPAMAGEEFAVYTRVEEIGESSLILTQRVADVKTGDVKAAARCVMVGFDILKAEKMVIPDSWRQAINNYESE
ncbi:MAG: acyl-CoA thioesterase [Bacteroidales bacterium]|nr:acyl-CoA thioesterase [Bacteroidales bacterium]